MVSPVLILIAVSLNFHVKRGCKKYNVESASYTKMVKGSSISLLNCPGILLVDAGFKRFSANLVASGIRPARLRATPAQVASCTAS